MTLKIDNAINLLESIIADPSKGLPEEVFQFISRVTPLVNVDLLIKDENNRTVLTWRDDDCYKSGWHIPGGVIRYKEDTTARIMAVAAKELGAGVSFIKNPLLVSEIFLPIKNRAHAISLLYECKLLTALDEARRFEEGSPKPGQWAWHNKCPDNLIDVHDIYRKFI